MRQNPETKQVAVKMDTSVTAGAYFLLDTKNGGYYGDGAREEVQDWPILAAQ